jgi:hypothetical protein
MNSTISISNPQIDITGGLAGASIICAVTFVVALFYKYFGHSRIKSACCGKTAELSLDLDAVATPKNINVPTENMSSK